MIISASRRTDIPAFYGDWFINRIKSGFVFVRSPFGNNVVSRIILSPDIVDCVVFWTKNPEPFIDKLKLIEQYRYYFLFTLTGYGTDLERNIPGKKEIIGTFKKLSEKAGEGRVIWRYDPVIYTDSINIDYHLENFEHLAKELHGHTGKCIISFLCMYNKCKRNLQGTGARELREDEMFAISAKISAIADSYNIKTEACAVKTDLSSYGISPCSCIDKELIENIVGRHLTIGKDKNQRKECNCYESIDIGEYNTCLHNCLYCYANNNFETAAQNYRQHDVNSPFLTGRSLEGDIIRGREQKSLVTDDL
jgi:hypothetical protein